MMLFTFQNRCSLEKTKGGTFRDAPGLPNCSIYTLYLAGFKNLNICIFKQKKTVTDLHFGQRGGFIHVSFTPLLLCLLCTLKSNEIESQADIYILCPLAKAMFPKLSSF